MASPTKSDDMISHFPTQGILDRNSKNDDERVKYIKIALQHVRFYAQDGKKNVMFAEMSADPRQQARLETTRALLSWLEKSVDMNPALKVRGEVEKILAVVQNTIHRFPPDVQIQARDLQRKWEEQSWGGEFEEDEVGHVQNSAAEPTVHLPPIDHPIWGINGIMHGLAKKEFHDARNNIDVLNKFYAASKRNPRVYGHNGLAVGQWFPTQLSALFHGAHGSPQAGVHGDPGEGAYSIVVSGAYAALNLDRGEVLKYSGARSQNNTDSSDDTDGTKYLIASFKSQNLVRVIRAAIVNSYYAPSVGMRYDGLYKVVKYDPEDGPHGRFTLVRDDDNNDDKTLDDCKRSPSAEEWSAWWKRNEQYW